VPTLTALLAWALRLAAPLLLAVLLAAPLAPAQALGVGDLPPTAPADPVLDRSGVLSRATAGEIAQRLRQFDADHVDARLVTVDHLDYGLGLDQLGRQLVERWGAADGGSRLPLLLLLIDSQNRAASLTAAPVLVNQLPSDLLESTARATVTPLLRDGGLYRQAVVAGLDRLGTVLQGGEDPGEPEEPEVTVAVSNVPSREETQSSNAFTWVVVLLVVGSIVPMLTWWVFSR